MEIVNTQHTLEDKKVIYAHYERQLALLKEEIEERKAEKKISLLGVGTSSVWIQGFKSDEIALQYNEAFQTMILLRQQPGSEVPNDKKYQSAIVCIELNKLTIYGFGDIGVKKMSFISPFFASKEDTQRAIDTVGVERILRMFRILHGVEV
tara:strand:- start:13436 stop:13888 length:453 start_codon:yes stop_codon:yes gene_type:complete